MEASKCYYAFYEIKIRVEDRCHTILEHVDSHPLMFHWSTELESSQMYMDLHGSNYLNFY